MSHPRPTPDADSGPADGPPPAGDDAETTPAPVPPGGPAPAGDPARAERPHRLELNPVQVVAGTGGAVCAAVLTSYFGVTGTVAGTAATSVLATVGTAVYTNWLRRGRTVIQTTSVRLPITRRADGPGPAPDAPAGGPGEDAPDRPAGHRRAGGRWGILRPQRPLVVALSCLLVFGLAIGIVSLIEVSTGRTLNAVVTGKKTEGVSILGGGSGGSSTTTPAPTTTPTPATSPTGSTTTGTTPTPTATPTPTGSGGTTPTPTDSTGTGATPEPSTSPTTGAQETPVPSASPSG